MSEEIFEIVDERDEVVGHKLRSDVHAQGLRHRAVHILVFNKIGELFLQKRSMKKDCFPGAWDSSASGHVAPEENYDDCAVRELREELGVVLSEPLRKLFKIDACPETGQEFAWVYQHEAEGPFDLAAEEIECGDWFKPGDISRWIEERQGDFAGAFPLIWQMLADQKDSRAESR